MAENKQNNAPNYAQIYAQNNAQNNAQNYNIDMSRVIAYVPSNGIIRVPNNTRLYRSNIKAGISVKEAGYRLCFPWVFHNTIISFNIFTKRMPQSEFKVEGKNDESIEIKFSPIVTFKIIDGKKFYEQFCGIDGKTKISIDDASLSKFYDAIMNSIRRLVLKCDVKTVSDFKLELIEQTAQQSQQQNQIRIKYENTNLPSDVQNNFISDLSTATKRYGIAIVSLGFEDINEPETLQDTQTKKAQADMENQMKIEAAQADAEATRIRIQAEIQPLLDAGIPVDEIAKIIQRKNLPSSAVLVEGNPQNEQLMAMFMSVLQNQNDKEPPKNRRRN